MGIGTKRGARGWRKETLTLAEMKTPLREKVYSDQCTVRISGEKRKNKIPGVIVHEPGGTTRDLFPPPPQKN